MAYGELNLDPVPKRVEHIYQSRLDIFLQTGQYKDLNLPAVYELGRVSDDYVKLSTWSAPGFDRPPFSEAMKGNYVKAQKGQSFGPSWATHWFRFEFKVPEKWKNETQVLLQWNSDSEGMIYTDKGVILGGLSGSRRMDWIIPESYRDGKWKTVYIEIACNGLFGNAGVPDHNQPPKSDRYFTLETADLVVPNLEALALENDFFMIAECARHFPQDSWQRHRALKLANDIMDTFDVSDPSTIQSCRKIAQKFLGPNIDSSKVFDTGMDRAEVFAIGHCHIDTAWLWPYAETRRKVARSWSSQLDLIERYPEYTFVCSQAVQYKWLKEDYPELFERVKKAVAGGRFIPTGGSWVESDTNLPSGESIARQFLYGQRFFMDNFDIKCKTFWLPDTFGYSAQLPQLCREAGLERFVTQKLSWNNINKFPNTTFNWTALDGSQVLCHMPPSDTYNARGYIEELNRDTINNKNADVCESSLYLFGIGDGGGGPTPDMLERLRRIKGISDTVGHASNIAMGTTVEDYFDKVLEKTNDGKDLVTWVGELYFEYHRGTYTTESKIKRNNRFAEVFLHDLEYLATIASIRVKSYKYPKAELDDIWDIVLLNQFHDVLPGTSIEMVNDDVKDLYSQVFTKLENIRKDVLAALGFTGNLSGDSIAAINVLPWERSEVLKVKPGTSVPSKLSTQSCEDGSFYALVRTDKSGLLQAEEEVETTVSVKEIEKGTFVLENSALRATVIGGTIRSIFDKDNKREVIADGGKANKYVLFNDQPLNRQAWDTELYSLHDFRDVSEGIVKIHENGPLRASLLVEQQISEVSWIKTVISLDARSSPSAPSSIEFNLEVEWRESCKFLKVEFPVDVHNDTASFDTMYGVVKRPTHYNTSWDVAKFEVCCHKYADLSDHTYGVSVLNDSKYGFSVHGNVMRLSVLRAPKVPDPTADLGRHTIRYAIRPHNGGLTGDVVRAAYNFNHPLVPFVTSSTNFPNLDSLIFEGPPNVILSTVKRGEDDEDVSTGVLPSRSRKSKNVIVRLYDSLGGKTSGSVVTSLPVKRAFICNILEDDKKEIAVEVSGGGKVSIPVTLRAFQVLSLRLEL